jgi:predicted unusual protein kinase regulating ubiquinone biosynthesis (AarF/ABC1/UbiB family)
MYFECMQFFVADMWSVLGDTYSRYVNKRYWIKLLSTRIIRSNWLLIKILQAIAEKSHWMGDDIVKTLREMTNNVPWDKDDYPENLTPIKIEDIWNVRILNFDAPMNSGMISLVFDAVDATTGKPMIVKIRRRNILQRLEHAKSSLHNILRIFDNIYLKWFLPLSADRLRCMVNEVYEIMQDQTDFSREVDNILCLRDQFKDDPFIIIPDVVEEATKWRVDVIIMERIEGVAIHEIAESDKPEFARLIVHFGQMSTMVHGVVHGDLHSGNILFQIKEDGGRALGIIDVAVLHKLSTRTRDALNDLMYGIFALGMSDLECTKCVIESELILGNLRNIDTGGIVSLFHEINSNWNKWESSEIMRWVSRFAKLIFSLRNDENETVATGELFRLYTFILMAYGVTSFLCENRIEKHIRSFYTSSIKEDTE